MTFEGCLATLAVLQDVATRKRAEEALRKKEGRGGNLFETLPISICQVT